MLREALQTAELHFRRAEENYLELQNLELNRETLQQHEIIKTVDAFLFRFIKLQDFIGDKLFKELLKRIGEYKDSMSLLDILDKLEKIEIVTDADSWLQYRSLRNALTHEYPDNESDVLSGIKNALTIFSKVGLILNNVKTYISLKKLI